MSINWKHAINFVPFVLALASYVGLLVIPEWRYKYADSYTFVIQVIGLELYFTHFLLIAIKLYDNALRPAVMLRIKSFTILFPASSLILLFVFISYSHDNMTSVNAQYLYSIIYIFILFTTTSALVLKLKISTARSISLSTIAVNNAKKNSEEILLNPHSHYKFSNDQYQKYHLELKDFIDKQLYLDPDMNADRLIKLLNIPRYHVSAIIKEIYDESVNGFINVQRITFAADELKQDDFNYTIDGLSAVSGFKSRSSFYRNFFSIYACSPHEFRKQYLKNHQLV
ncbi:helix-turn-helix domain-containing protein [Sphingobacterium corticis]|uniref:Helix-turn-helix domain-containing protein n=1 Tax=Sphingobacterium corticis TaxID=1812823 RepID=A0ABW5NK31_9SPHI